MGPKSPLEEILAETKRELSTDRQAQSAHMQAITNGYSIATTLVAKMIEVSKAYDIENTAISVNTLAGKISSSIFADYTKALKEHTIET